MNPQGAQNYLRTKVLTATPEQLQLMLFDGAIRFGEQARVALVARNFEQSFKALVKMQKIITELNSGLRPDVHPQLCDKLRAIYNYVYRKLIDANVKHNIEALDESLKLLKYQRETWAMLMDKLGKEKAAHAAAKIDMPSPNERMEASISLQG